MSLCVYLMPINNDKIFYKARMFELKKLQTDVVCTVIELEDWDSILINKSD